jgi:hypothetical protein
MHEERLLEIVNESRSRMTFPERRFWDAISILPEKWQQHPYGDVGGGFWVVAVIGSQVVWYNDIEEGFNRSTYRVFGKIHDDEYWCNQDDLEMQVRQLMHLVESGYDGSGKFGPPQAGEFRPG